jgi:ketosteroid isomerase-like protein
MSKEVLEALRAEYAAMSRKDCDAVHNVAVPDFELKSSAFLERRAAHLWTMRGNKATRLEIFPRREEALEAAGLSE